MKTKILVLMCISISFISFGQKKSTCDFHGMLKKAPELTEIECTKTFSNKLYSNTDWKDREKFEIDRKNVLCFIVKDTNELGEYYSFPTQDDPTFIRSGYLQYNFYALQKINSKEEIIGFIYDESRDEWDGIYLCLYSQKGALLQKYIVDERGDKNDFFTASLISPDDYSVFRMTYSYAENQIDSTKSIIKMEFLKFDFSKNKYILKNKEEKKSKEFFSDFAQNDFDDDPLSKQNIDATKAEFKRLIDETK